MKKFITTTGYYGTGSSAITDVLSEYDNIFSMTDYEFRFIQDPDGILDLEYKIVKNNHRHNTGHAIKKYIKKVNFLNGTFYDKKYRIFFGNRWKLESEKYISSLIDFQYKGYWHQDLIDKGRFIHFYKRALNKVLKKTIWKNQPERSLNELPREITYCSFVDQKRFIDVTKEYINNLFQEIGYDKEYIMIDQIVASSNISEYTKFFDSIKVFLIDRDPRDIYILEKYIYKGSVVPVENIETFCIWFKKTREHRKNEVFDVNTMFLFFEDLVYKYDETINLIEKWLKLEPNKNKKTKFNPDVSIKNTRLWINYPDEKVNIEIIQNELKEFLYEKK